MAGSESRDPAKRDGFAGPSADNSFEVRYHDNLRRLGWYWTWDDPNFDSETVPWRGPFRSSRAAYLDALRGDHG